MLLLSLVLTVIAWTCCGMSYMVQWSQLTAGPTRPHTPGPSPALGPGSQEERDETHIMFGRGRIAVLQMPVFTVSFSAPNSDLNSRSLAWAVFDDYFPPWRPWRLNLSAGRSVVGVYTWFPAALITGLCALLALRVHRLVPAGHCTRCRYDLQSTAAQEDGTVICPECGMIQLLNVEKPAWYRGWL